MMDGLSRNSVFVLLLCEHVISFPRHAASWLTLCSSEVCVITCVHISVPESVFVRSLWLGALGLPQSADTAGCVTPLHACYINTLT